MIGESEHGKLSSPILGNQRREKLTENHVTQRERE